VATVIRDDLVDAVLARLGLEQRPASDLPGLQSLYAAWCGSVPFDNSLKLIHSSEGLPWPLPGATADDFFGSWLEHGTGGTCWAGNGALHDLLAALGFAVERAIATMMPVPDIPGPNHGSVVVTIERERWIADASILSGAPIRIPEAGIASDSSPMPRFEWLDGRPAVSWRILNAPDGFPCRIERIGADREEWDALHRQTVRWSPFNYQLNTRLFRDGLSFGAAGGQRFVFRRDGTFDASPLEGEERAVFLVKELGISEEIAARVPADRPIPPRP
jgi:N-hydroxyarylamine O-acetyltransferase